MTKRASLIGKFIVKLVSKNGSTIYYPYVDAVVRAEGGWDTYAHQRDSKPFDTVKEARAWVDMVQFPSSIARYGEMVDHKIAYRRIVARKAT